MGKGSRQKITKRAVEALQAGQTIWDSEIRGFGARCQKDRKAYVLKTSMRGRQVWLTIGAHGSPWTTDNARSEALRLLGEIHSGRDPTKSQPNRSGRVRMSDLGERYMRDHAGPHKKASSALTDRKNIENHILPVLGRLFVEEVSRSDIEEFHRTVREGRTAKPAATSPPYRGGGVVRGGSGVANRCCALLSKMFNLAEAWDLRPQNSNPVRAIKRARENKKERFLSPAEIARLAGVLDEAARHRRESPFVVAAIRLLMLTGARLGEILTLRWTFIDVERALIRLPDSKTGPKVVRLNSATTEVLGAIP